MLESWHKSVNQYVELDFGGLVEEASKRMNTRILMACDKVVNRL